MERMKLNKVWETVRRTLVIVIIASILCSIVGEYGNVFAEKANSSDDMITKDVPVEETKEINENDISSSGITKKIYFDTAGNGGWNGWTKDCNMYIYLLGSTSKTIRPMTKSSKTNTLLESSTGTLWEYTISEADAGCTGVIFVNQSTWGEETAQTVDISFASGAVSTDPYPCFKLNGGSEGSKKTVDYLGSLVPKSLAGKTMYFFDMTGSLNSVIAKFGNENNGTVTTNMTADTGTKGLYSVTVPSDENGIAYNTVEFYNINSSLGEVYDFADAGSDGYDAAARNTLYYGASEINSKKYSRWDAKVTGSESLAGHTLYFSRLHFPVSEGSKIQIGSGSAIALPATGSVFEYTFESNTTATQQTMLTFIKEDGTKYHFLWSDLTKNEVIVVDKFAEVSSTYSNALTVYFDATLSKLTYSYADGTNGGTAGKSDYGIPNKSGRIRYYATGTGKEDIEGDMELVPAYSNGTNTYSDVYKVDLPEGYTNIAFSSFDMSSITNYGAHGESTTNLTIPTDLSNPCFYADTSDNVIYDGGQRDGYWGEVYTVRNPEQKGDTAKTVVDIPQKEEGKSDPTKLYLSTTFYDFYTDYELNGNNRDDYTYNANNHRIYQPFRQFNQALSEFYLQNGAASPLYWGNFQNYKGSPFSEISADMNLYGYNNTSKFFYENNSMWGRNGGELPSGLNATIGLVSDTLSDGNLMIKTSSGTVQAPFLNESFLSGNNSKNTVLGKVYNNVTFPFTQQELESSSAKVTGNTVNGTVPYWVFDSRETNLRLTQDTGTNNYYLDSTEQKVKGQTTDGVTADGNFFPFNGSSQSGNAGKLNYGFATKLEINFRLTESGTVLTDEGDEAPIEFNFSGDDDIWIFIDGNLVLDIGGGHGRVQGYVNFNTKKSWVSSIKNPDADGTITGNQDTANIRSFNLTGENTDEHTLTMFYMERGIWESNMFLSFNFPDENTFEVEKQVDDSEVNDLFAGLFDNASIFPFEIKNQATHWEPKEISNTIKSPIMFNDTFASGTISKGSTGNTFQQIAEFAGQSNVVHYKALYSDTSGANRNKRFGIIAPAVGQTIDISDASDCLRFRYYFDEKDTPALNYMYIELEDASGNTIGGKLNGRTYLSAAMRSKQWSAITVDLTKLTGALNFDYSRLRYIKFAYDVEADFYFDGFEFYSQSYLSSSLGFTTNQHEIPDYGSATSGKLEYPQGAIYTLTGTGNGNGTSYRSIGDDGIFSLMNGQSAIFTDQFRRGSYISLTENIDQDVFECTYTIYENEAPVTSMTEGEYVILGSAGNLNNVKSVAIDDGRTEKVVDGEDGNGRPYKNQGYTEEKRPSEPAIVFRSFSNPDMTLGATKLKVVYTNKVKTGSLTIRKEKANGSDNLTGEYKFKVTFSNVAGLALEDEAITKEITLRAGESETISGIPMNTYFEIEEITPEDGSALDSVTENNNQEFDMDVQTKKVTGAITSSASSYDFTFKNTTASVITLKLVKLWKDSNGNDLTENIPSSIDVQIQRRVKGTTASYQVVTINNQDKITMSKGYGTWEYTLEGLEQYKDDAEWEYRVVELDEYGNVIEEGGFVGSYQVSYEMDEEAKTITGTITNTYQSTNIKIIKVDATDNSIKLSDVEFTLEKLKDNGTVDDTFTKVTANTEIDGVAVFSDLKDGTYRLTETKTKSGYKLLKQSITIVINRSGQSTIDEKNCTVTADTITVTISNHKKFVLPFTGGYGRTIFLLVGIVCIVAAVFFYLYRKKKIKLFFN